MKPPRPPRIPPAELGPGHWRIDDLYDSVGGYTRQSECRTENPSAVVNECLVEEAIVSEWRFDGAEWVPANVGTRISPRGSRQWLRWIDETDTIRSTPIDVK